MPALRQEVYLGFQPEATLADPRIAETRSVQMYLQGVQEELPLLIKPQETLHGVARGRI